MEQISMDERHNTPDDWRGHVAESADRGATLHNRTIVATASETLAGNVDNSNRLDKLRAAYLRSKALVDEVQRHACTARLTREAYARSDDSAGCGDQK